MSSAEDRRSHGGSRELRAAGALATLNRAQALHDAPTLTATSGTGLGGSTTAGAAASKLPQ
jgi:hypothetical protein